MRVRRLAAWTALPLAVTAGPRGLRQRRRRWIRWQPTQCGGQHPDRRAAAPGSDEHHRDARCRRCSPPCSARSSTTTRQNKPYEVAAESITSTDNKVWTIKLKDGYTFHNGEKVTADNYINAWNYGAYAPNGQNSNYFFERIDGLRRPAAGGRRRRPEGAGRSEDCPV